MVSKARQSRGRAGPAGLAVVAGGGQGLRGRAVGRGNPRIKGTETFERISGRKLAEHSFEEAPISEKLDAELTQMLMAAGKR